jgi:phage terminase large subunit
VAVRQAPKIVEIPYAPRPLQAVLHEALERHRWSVVVTHRRFGKTVLAVNHLQRAACRCKKERPRFHYVAPTFRMGKAGAWDYMKFYSSPIPGVTTNESELRINYPNGAQLQILGSDNPDSARGIYSDGAVFDEYGLQPPNVFTEVWRPAFSDREGWALFLGTPNGKNQFYDVAQQAKRTDGWLFQEYKASQTSVLSEAELQAARSVMTEDEYLQEFECSFEAAIKGSIYGTELTKAANDGRITVVPYDPVLPVDTDWDLGVGDSTAIWFSQSLRSGELRLIDFYESSGEGLPHYAQVLKDKGYSYGTHWAPHDIQAREFTSGRSRLETALSLGIKFAIVPNIPIEDGIHAARMLLPICWFDVRKTEAGREALQHYRRDYNTRLNEFKAAPVHDWASHAADAFRGLAVRFKQRKDKQAKTFARPVYEGRPDQAWMS